MRMLVRLYRYNFVVSSSLSSTYPSRYACVGSSSTPRSLFKCEPALQSAALLIALSLVVYVFPSLAAEPDAAQAAEKAAQPYQPIVQKLERWDAEAAWADLKPLLAKEPKNVELLQLASETAFFRGDYDRGAQTCEICAGAGRRGRRKKRFRAPRRVHPGSAEII